VEEELNLAHVMSPRLLLMEALLALPCPKPFPAMPMHALSTAWLDLGVHLVRAQLLVEQAFKLDPDLSSLLLLTEEWLARFSPRPNLAHSLLALSHALSTHGLPFRLVLLPAAVDLSLVLELFRRTPQMVARHVLLYPNLNLATHSRVQPLQLTVLLAHGRPLVHAPSHVGQEFNRELAQ
jgi:hypothetical protein